jgi:hypothetical protein
VADDTDVETQIMLLQSPFGGAPHVRERERAAAWLVSHADQAYPRLLAMLRDGSATPAVIEILPAFDRAESVPALEALLGAADRTAFIAGQALARHTGAEASAALRRGVRRSEPDAAVAAAAGLEARRDAAACPDLIAGMRHADPRVRYQTTRAAIALGCLTRQQLQALSAPDVDDDIRAMASAALARRS